MRSVLGIDAAWSPDNPSGVALIKNETGRWECVAVAPSYDAFIGIVQCRPVRWDDELLPVVEDLLTAAHRLLGEPVTVVAVDMPLSTEQINELREADRRINKRFRPKGCGVLTPTADSPGTLSDQLRQSLDQLGYRLAVNEPDRICISKRATIEVYPHPALLCLMNWDYRVAYKISRWRTYWPNLRVCKDDSPERKKGLIRELVNCHLLPNFREIRRGLTYEIAAIPDFLPGDSYAGSLKSLKRYEDALDALVCAWVGARYLAGCATAYGDNETAAIWVPNSRANPLPPGIRLIRANRDPHTA